MAAEDELRRQRSTTVLLVYCLAYDEDRGICFLCTQEEFSAEKIRLVTRIDPFLLPVLTRWKLRKFL